MSNRTKFILAEIVIYLTTHLLNLIYGISVVCINSDLKIYWTQRDYFIGWILLGVSLFVYLFIMTNYYKRFKKIGLGFIFSIITELLYIAISVSSLVFYADEWNMINIGILIFSFTGLPILFAVTAIIYFVTKKLKNIE